MRARERFASGAFVSPPGIPLASPDQPTDSWKHPAPLSTLVLGRYRILEQVGAGGMGAVFKALHINLKQVVAIKTIRLGKDRSRDAGLTDRFLREMEAVGA